MHKFLSMAALAAAAMLLGGCGGGAFSSTSTSTGTGTLTTLSVASSIASLPADGSASATITATASDGSGKPLGGVAVTFTSDSGTITTNQGTTDATGKATATLAKGTAAAGSQIKVTATSGTVTGNATVAVAAAQQSVSLQTSSPTMPSDNSAPATITAIVKDANNNFVPGVTVSFQATSGGLAINAPAGGTAGQTGTSGAATATLSVADDPSVRTITITASVGSSTATIDVKVVGTSVTVSGPQSLVLGTAATYTVAMVDAGNKPIAGKTVAVTSSAGNTLSAASLTTDASGHANFTVNPTKAGSDTLTATALGTSGSEGVTVSNQQFQFTAPSTTTYIPIAPACTPNVPVTVSWTASNAPVADGTTVNFSATRGTLSASTATTTGGVATVMICATTAGPSTLTASGTGAGGGVSASETVIFVSTTPSTIDLQASPSTVSITAQSTFTAVVRDAAGNFVQGQEVDFKLTDVTGGSLSVATAITDVEGVAQTVYTAGKSASATNGVSVLAQVASNTTINRTATLTVNGAALHIVLGTGKVIRENATKTAFIEDWFVSVADATSNPLPNNKVTLTLHSTSRPKNGYFKGAYQICAGFYVPTDGMTVGCSTLDPTAPLAPPTPCLNEDINLSGVYDAAEDINKDGVLEPGDVAVASPGVVTTGSDGTTTFTITYPEDHANWVEVTLTATASVSGTESSTSTTFVLPILADYLKTGNGTPPGNTSPYGIGACTAKP
jgi:hypothetical protein